MLAFALLILMAWFIEMPLWLSITTTIVCGVVIMIKFVKLFVEIIKLVNGKE